ncbi:MAG: ribosomal protein S18-alanine N-acetyltransferase [Gammaproteobacteria bacterium]|nr:ribosomal protein S18-alanine N-acetyltransferase [Gammaproteobacteria bacterium]
MQQEDLQQVLAIEELVYDFPWTRGIFTDCLKAGYCCWVITLDATVIGYGVMSVAVEECHILNVCVHPRWQAQGIGGRLFRHLIQLSRQHGALNAFLEVRVSNRRALQLYERLGFTEAGRRKGYYPSIYGREDALVLTMRL